MGLFEVSVSSADDLFHAAERMSRRFPDGGGNRTRWRSGIWYRGEAKEYPSLKPKFFRLVDEQAGRPVSCGFEGERATWEQYYRREWYNIFFNFKQRLPVRLARPIEPDADIVSLMQHFGAPTYLLDWTESFLCACYFAVAAPLERGEDLATSGEDAYVYAIDAMSIGKVFQRSTGIGELKNLIDRIAFPHQQSPVAQAAWPSYCDGRLSVQQGVFTVHSTGGDLRQVPGMDRCMARIKISAAFRNELAWFLAASGLVRRHYFPDTDGLAANIGHDNLYLWPRGGGLKPRAFDTAGLRTGDADRHTDW